MYLKLICIFHLILLTTSHKGTPGEDCLARDYGNGGTVCVCNSDHCDSIETVTSLPAGQYVQFTSSQGGLRFHKTVSSFTQEKLHDIVIEINPDKIYQKILGWGGAFTDSSGLNINSLSEDLKEKLLKSYFGKNGIEYTLCRIPIAGTDFSTRAYTYDDFDDNEGLSKFNLTQEDFEYKIPLVKKAIELQKGKINFVASAWSPPKWMKTNDDYTGFGFVKTEMYQAWADYHLKFLQAYDKEGIDIWALTTGNEPINGLLPVPSINTVGWTPSSQSTWIRENFGPTIKSLYPNIKLIALDDQRFFLPWWINWLLKDENTRQYIDGIGIHWYYDSITPATFLDWTHNNFPDKFLLYTEACVGDRPWQEKVSIGSWERGEWYIEDIIENLHNWVTGWIDWNIALDTKGGPNWVNNFVDSPILVNATANEFYKQPMFYALGHFSKFIPPESVKIETTPINGKIQSVAFLRPDDGTTVVLYNGFGIDKKVTLKDTRRGHINLLLKKHSIQTFVYW